MTLQFSETFRNNQLDQFEVTTGTAARLILYVGAQPANCAAAAQGAVLATLILPSDWMNAAGTGSKTLLGAWTVAASGAGVAGHFRVWNSGVTVCHAQGTCGIGTGDLQLDNTNIAAGQTVTVTTFTLNAGGA